jgi:hypothetical protein
VSGDATGALARRCPAALPAAGWTDDELKRGTPVPGSSIPGDGQRQHPPGAIESQDHVPQEIPSDDGVPAPGGERLQVLDAAAGELDRTVIEQRLLSVPRETGGANDAHRRQIQLGDDIVGQRAQIRSGIELSLEPAPGGFTKGR